MERSYRNKLLRAAAEKPSNIATQAKFWKLAWWPHYLRRCNEFLFDDPRIGLAFAKPAPQLASKIAAAHPGANGADLLLLAHSYLGSAYRAVSEYAAADDAFKAALAYRDSASPTALAEHLKRLAYLRLFQHDAECFEIIGEAIAIHKRGSLVQRHELGECLLCRGHAYFEFKQPGKSLEDLSASLNHISLRIDDRPWYCAVHNLAVWAVDHGTDAQLRIAYNNLKPVLTLLNTVWKRTFAKLKLRWLIAQVAARLGSNDRTELVYLEVRDSLTEMKLPYEVGMLQVDLALLYLAQGRRVELEALVEETAAIFRAIGVKAKAEEVLDIWRGAEGVTEDLLKQVRGLFADETSARPAIAT